MIKNSKYNEQHSLSFLFFQRIRWYCMISTPFIIFYAIGMIFQSGLDYLIKLIAFVALYIAIYTASNYIYDERLYYVMPMSVYLATKVCNRFTP